MTFARVELWVGFIAHILTLLVLGGIALVALVGAHDSSRSRRKREKTRGL